jgi:hypothetical protein
MSDIIEMKKVQVLMALDRANSPAPMEYISERSDVEDPYELLVELQKDGLVRQVEPSTWSPSGSPQFELAPNAKELLEQFVARKLLQAVEAHA